MTMYKGPCQKCGVYVERHIKSGRGKLCIEHALEKQAAQQRGFADGTDPRLALSRGAGEELARQIAQKSGPLYTRWLQGQINRLVALTTTEGETSDTVPG